MQQEPEPDTTDLTPEQPPPLPPPPPPPLPPPSIQVTPAFWAKKPGTDIPPADMPAWQRRAEGYAEYAPGYFEHDPNYRHTAEDRWLMDHPRPPKKLGRQPPRRNHERRGPSRTGPAWDYGQFNGQAHGTDGEMTDPTPKPITPQPIHLVSIYRPQARRRLSWWERLFSWVVRRVSTRGRRPHG